MTTYNSAHLHFGFPAQNTIIDSNNANSIASTASCCANPPRRTSTNTRTTDINLPTSATTWNFASPNGAQGWTPISALGTAVQHNEGIWFAVLGNDPYLHSPILTGIPAANYSHINIVMASQTDTCGQLYFRRQGDANFAESRVVNFTVNPNGGTNTYRVDMRTSANWNGNIVQIRLDPACRAVGNRAVRIDRIEFFSYPGKPTITAPANGAVVNNPVTVTIQRGALNTTGRYNFNVEVATSPTFGTSVVYQSGWAAENRTTFQLPTLANGIYYVRAQQGDMVYWSGAWSNTSSFSIGLVDPSNLTANITTARRVDLTWRDNSSIETGFRIERRQVADARGIAVAGTWAQIGTAPANATTYQDRTGLVCNARYEYRVRAEGSSTLSGYSNSASVLVICAAPPALRIVAPVNNGFTNDTTPTVEWQPAIAASGYRVQIASDSRFRNVIAEYDGAQTSFTTLNTLANGLHFWRVQGYNSVGTGRWTTARFTVDTTAPSVPVQTQLPNNSQTDNQRPTFRWTAVRDEASNPVAYEVRMDTSNPPVSIYENRSTSFRPVTPLLVGRTYYWQVRAIDRAGNASAWSPVWSVFIDASSRAVPLRWRYTTITPTLRWTRISWATAYEIQVDDVNTFRSVEFTRNNITHPTSGHPSVTTTSLPAGVYFWRVRAQRTDGTWSAWSAVDSFYIE